MQRKDLILIKPILRQRRKGIIIPNGVSLKEHENKTVILLTEYGFDIELIPKSNIQGLHTPDIKINSTKWEIKSPKGKGNWLIKNTLQRASHQSVNIIIDLRRIKIPQEKCLSEIKKQFLYSKRIKKIMVVTKKGKILDFYK